MGTFRCGLLLSLALVASPFAQDTNQPVPATAPVVDPNQPAAAPTVTPVVDPNLPQIPQAEATLTPPPETVAPIATNKPAPPKKKPAPQIPTARGSVAKIDNVGMTITVENKGKEQTFKVSSKTRIFADAKPAIFADGKPGEKVIVEYKTNKDKSKEATTIRFGSPTLKKQ